MAAMIEIYRTPDDPAAFEDYYAHQHIPFATEHMPGVTGAQNLRVLDTAVGEEGYYRISQMTFESPAAMRQAIASDDGQSVLRDLDSFATGGATVLLVDE
jgi:uncharacterized protein (TIGR02118 family)